MIEPLSSLRLGPINFHAARDISPMVPLSLLANTSVLFLDLKASTRWSSSIQKGTWYRTIMSWSGCDCPDDPETTYDLLETEPFVSDASKMSDMHLLVLSSLERIP